MHIATRKKRAPEETTADNFEGKNELLKKQEEEVQSICPI